MPRQPKQADSTIIDRVMKLAGELKKDERLQSRRFFPSGTGLTGSSQNSGTKPPVADVSAPSPLRCSALRTLSVPLVYPLAAS